MGKPSFAELQGARFFESDFGRTRFGTGHSASVPSNKVRSEALMPTAPEKSLRGTDTSRLREPPAKYTPSPRIALLNETPAREAPLNRFANKVVCEKSAPSRHAYTKSE